MNRRVTALALACGLALAACTDGGRPLPVVDIAVASLDAVAPGPGDVLVDGGWPEVAAFVAEAAAAGDATVVNIFASWCGPCERELPMLLDVASRTDGVRFVGVASEDRRDDAEPFVARLKITWPTVLDPTATTHIALDGVAMPTTAFFSADGELVQVIIGEMNAEQLTDALDRIRP